MILSRTSSTVVNFEFNPDYGRSISIENNRKEMGHVLEKK